MNAQLRKLVLDSMIDKSYVYQLQELSFSAEQEGADVDDIRLRSHINAVMALEFSDQAQTNMSRMADDTETTMFATMSMTHQLLARILDWLRVAQGNLKYQCFATIIDNAARRAEELESVCDTQVMRLASLDSDVKTQAEIRVTHADILAAYNVALKDARIAFQFMSELK